MSPRPTALTAFGSWRECRFLTAPTSLLLGQLNQAEANGARVRGGAARTQSLKSPCAMCYPLHFEEQALIFVDSPAPTGTAASGHQDSPIKPSRAALAPSYQQARL